MNELLNESASDFRRCWRRLFLTGIFYQLITFILLTPLVSVLFRFFVSMSGKTLLADQDILFFFVAPLGWLCLITVGALWLGIMALQLAAMMAIVADKSAHSMQALRFAMVKAWPTINLTARFVFFALLSIAPFLALAAGVYFMLLGEFDINFYLAKKPPVFMVALGIGAVIAVSMVAVLLRLFSGWVFALPMVLFEGITPAKALGLSRERATGQRRRILICLVLWFVATFILSAVATTIVVFVAKQFVTHATDSLELMAVAIGLSLIGWSIVNLVVGLISTTTLATLGFNLFRKFGGGKIVDAPANLPRSAWVNLTALLTRGRILAVCLIGLVIALATGFYVIRSVPLDDRVEVIAHRGASKSAPENTMAAIKQAIADGTDCVEIDVQETADGTVVVFHDSDFMKLADMNLKIWDATMKDLEDIDIGSWFAPEFKNERVPTLADVLDTCKGKVGIYIELKYYGHDVQLEQKVVDLVENHGMSDEVVIISLSVDAIEKMKSLRPRWKTGLLMSVVAGDLSKMETDLLAVNASFASRSFVSSANDAGKGVCVWTVNDPIGMSTMISRGVNGLITDKPAVARSVLEQRAQMSAPERLILELAGLFGVVPEAGDQ